MTDTQAPIPGIASPLGATKTPRPPDWVTCGKCHARWTGLKTCHCAACHATFTGIAAFDTHRTGGQCTNPATLRDRNGKPRLIPTARQHWSGWATPGDDTRWDTE